MVLYSNIQLRDPRNDPSTRYICTFGGVEGSVVAEAKKITIMQVIF